MATEKTVEQRAEERVNVALRAIRRVGKLTHGTHSLPIHLTKQAFAALVKECDRQVALALEQQEFWFGDTDGDSGHVYRDSEETSR